MLAPTSLPAIGHRRTLRATGRRVAPSFFGTKEKPTALQRSRQVTAVFLPCLLASSCETGHARGAPSETSSLCPASTPPRSCPRPSRDLLGDGEAKAFAALGLRHRAADLMELLEDPALLIKRHAGTGICYRDGEVAVPCTRGDAYHDGLVGRRHGQLRRMPTVDFVSSACPCCAFRVVRRREVKGVITMFPAAGCAYLVMILGVVRRDGSRPSKLSSKTHPEAAAIILTKSLPSLTAFLMQFKSSQHAVPRFGGSANVGFFL